MILLRLLRKKNMKYTLFFVLLLTTLSFSSCDKCLECSNENYSQTVCDDMQIYKDLKKGKATLTDEVGDELKCK
jgi:hypothetical protein